MTQHSSRVFEVLQNAAEQLDTLQPVEQKQAMAMLAARYDMKITEKPTGTSSGYRPAPRRKTKPY